MKLNHLIDGKTLATGLISAAIGAVASAAVFVVYNTARYEGVEKAWLRTEADVHLITEKAAKAELLASGLQKNAVDGDSAIQHLNEASVTASSYLAGIKSVVEAFNANGPDQIAKRLNTKDFAEKVAARLLKHESFPIYLANEEGPNTLKLFDGTKVDSTKVPFLPTSKRFPGTVQSAWWELVTGFEDFHLLYTIELKPEGNCVFIKPVAKPTKELSFQIRIHVLYESHDGRQ